MDFRQHGARPAAAHPPGRHGDDQPEERRGQHQHPLCRLPLRDRPGRRRGGGPGRAGADQELHLQGAASGAVRLPLRDPDDRPAHLNGMYGMILVEPDGGLPEVDREFYVMQGELYTAQKHGSSGLQEFSLDKLLDERPEHLMFNGSMNALTKTFDMQANVGETVRMFFGVGGPNLTSSFHLIGEVFDRVHDLASFTSPPLTDVQTTLVPPGGATMVEFKVDYPGRYILVDHPLSRTEKGLVGFLNVHGEAADTIFKTSEQIDAASGP